MPVHNGGAYLNAAVGSILEQSLDNLELLIVDDHSDDGAIEQLPRDPRIRRVASRGRGIVAALNTGLSTARAPLIARMDGDDIALPGRLEQQREYLARQPGVGIAGAQVELFGDEPITDGYRRYQRWINGLTEPDDIARSLFIESPIPHPSAMWRAPLIEALGGYRDTPWPEDYDLWLRAHAAGIRMGKPTGILLRWRDHSNRLSRTDLRYATEQFFAAKAATLVELYLRERPAMVCGTGRQAVYLCDALRGCGAEVSHFVDIDPRRIGGSKRGIPIIGMHQVVTHRRGGMLLGAVAAWGARERLRSWLLSENFVEQRDFLLAA